MTLTQQNGKGDPEANSLVKHDGVIRLYADRLDLEKAGENRYRTNCPFHDDNDPSFDIDHNQGSWLWTCRSNSEECGGGNIIDFIRKFDKVSFDQAKKIVRDFLKDSFELKKERVEKVFKPLQEKKQEKTPRIPLSTWKSAVEALQTNHEALRWLEDERGISSSVAQQMQIGFRQDVGGLFPDKQLAASGWVSFPRIENGEVVGIKYRSIRKKAFTQQSGMKSALFNVDSIDPLEPVYVTEGELDAMTFEQAGFKAISIPSAQFAMTPEMKKQILSAYCVYLAGDSDAVGQEAMDKLWREIKERTFKIVWPDGIKDANQAYVKHCNRDIEKFRQLVIELTDKSKTTPMPSVRTLQSAILSSEYDSLKDHPERLIFPWKKVDDMMYILPGSVLAVFATNTGMGKSTWLLGLTLYNAMKKRNEVVLNYQCELSDEEMGRAAAANLMKMDRNKMTKEDRATAARLLDGVNYYIGHDTNLTTSEEVLDLIEDAIQTLGATIVVLDHIHFICRSEDDVKELASAMQRIKNMSRAYGVKFIVVGQPRKAEQGKKGRVAHITDAKGSESFTSDADGVILLHRNLDPQKTEEDGKDSFLPITEVHGLKARQKGPGGVFTRLMFVGKQARFNELTNVENPFEAGQPEKKQV